MEHTSALKWFWPFMGVATLAAATIIAFPTFAAKPTVDEPQFRMLVRVNAQGSQIMALGPVADPSCIGAKVKRSPHWSIVQKVASAFSQSS